MAGHSRREFGVLLGTVAGALFLPAGAGAVAASGCAGSFPFVVNLTAPRCSFCGRGAGVRFVTAGPISVCSECIALCLDILREAKNPRPPVEQRKYTPPNPADFVGLTRAEIAAKLSGSGAFDVPADTFEKGVDHLELSARMHVWKPGLSADDMERLMTTSLTREELTSLVLARGWQGTPDEPVFDRLLSRFRSVHREGRPNSAPPPPPGTASGTIYCSFCGTTQDLVEKLIAGPSVYICNHCIGRAGGLLSASV